MGHAPPRRRHEPPPPTAESFHLGRLREAYLSGRLDVGQFEDGVAEVLAGGTSSRLVPPPQGLPPRPRPDRLATVRG